MDARRPKLTLKARRHLRLRFNGEATILAVIIGIAATLRIAAARGDLWLDEIWSLWFARELRAPWQVLTAIHHDNNHPLNTLWLALVANVVGPHGPVVLFRALSLIAGTALAIVLFESEMHSSEDDAQRRRWIAAVLAATSFSAVVYSSEARGYAPAAFFAVAAFVLVRHQSAETSPLRRLGFAAVCMLGVLSHLTFLFAYAGVLAWTFARRTARGRFAARDWFVLHCLPLAFIVADYAVHARKLYFGGGPAFNIPDVIGRVLSLAAGGADAGPLLYVTAVSTACFVVWGIVDLVRRRSDETVFFATTLVLVPAGVLFAYRAEFLDVRYFFVLFPFVWLLATRSLASLYRQGRAGQFVATVLIAASIGGNIVHIAPLLREGRGHYADAVALMAADTPGREITVGSDHDFRNRFVLDYYGEVLPAGKSLRYVSSAGWTRSEPMWVITHDFEVQREHPPSTIDASNGGRYRFVRAFPYGGISGWTWYLYRREAK